MGNPVSGSAELEVECNPVPDAAVGRGNRPEGHPAESVPCPNLDLDAFYCSRGRVLLSYLGRVRKTPAVPHTVICSLQGSVGNPVSGSANDAEDDDDGGWVGRWMSE